MKKKVVLGSSAVLLCTIALTYTQCGKNAHIVANSAQEQKVYTTKIFKPFYDLIYS